MESADESAMEEDVTSLTQVRSKSQKRKRIKNTSQSLNNTSSKKLTQPKHLQPGTSFPQPTVLLSKLPDTLVRHEHQPHKPLHTEKTTSTNLIQHTQTTQPQQYNKPIISKKMQEAIRPTFHFAYSLQAAEGTTRLNVADAWSKLSPTTRDDIIQTARGFILKTNSETTVITPLLLQMISNKTIKNYSEIMNHNNQQTTRSAPSLTYSVVVHSVEPEISDIELSNHLNSIGQHHRFCKRIISRATDRPTRMIRVITGDVATFESLLGEGVYYRCRHYAVEPSRPPTPTPIACAKCALYTHTTDKCSTPIRCLKCNGTHATPQCTTPDLPAKCAACNVEGHVAWSIKCPLRPTAPIPGIPNIKIKPLNKKSNQVDVHIKKKPHPSPLPRDSPRRDHQHVHFKNQQPGSHQSRGTTKKAEAKIHNRT